MRRIALRCGLWRWASMDPVLSTPVFFARHVLRGCPGFRDYETRPPGGSPDAESFVGELSTSSEDASTFVAEVSPDSEPPQPRLWYPPEGIETGIFVKNGLTKSKVPIILKPGKTASWYACGPTVYDDAHIGHASCFVRFDVIRRILTDFFGLDIAMVLCITDIDDKIIARSQTLDLDPVELAKFYEGRFFSDLSLLNVLPPSFVSRVSEFVPQILDFVERLVRLGRAYESRGSVYLDFRALDELEPWPRLAAPRPGSKKPFVGAKNRTNEKKDARDVVLWKAAKEGEPAWKSPWGLGRPGWHVECSAMATAIFGSSLDIHSGGMDLIFPHHETEISQCHAYHDCRQWANYWLHSGALVVGDDEVKMSKSLNNVVSVESLLQSYTADQFRMLCLTCHYRSMIHFSSTKLDAAAETLHHIESFIHRAQLFMRGRLHCGPVDVVELEAVLERTKIAVSNALADDFDTPSALNHLKELMRRGNIVLSPSSESTSKPVNVSETGVFASYVSYIRRILRVFGMSSTVASSSSESTLDAVLDAVTDFRASVRNFALTTASTELTMTDNMSKKQQRAALLSERRPLLTACDDLRQRLFTHGLQLTDPAKNDPASRPSWRRVQDNVVENRKNKKEMEESTNELGASGNCVSS